MSVNAKDQTAGDLCKSHAARCDKDYLRICPSKLSKRELEDLYYSLLENNLELKRAVNSQNEKIRNLSTKVQRMTAQTRTSVSREPKECCAAAKAAISEQRASIADLKKANECMAERIRRLNMRLCSARQFLKRSPNQNITKCFNCISGASTSVKNLSTSALHDKTDDIDNLRSVALSAQSIVKKSSTTRTVETNTPECRDDDRVTDKICDENKCRTTMEEFKQKIVDLQEELSKTHTEYSARMSLLEQQVSALRAARKQSLRVDDAELARRLKDASVASELETKLKLERGKVAELEMRLKAADMSQQVAKTIEKHLSNVSQLEERRRTSQLESERCNICMSPRFTSNAVLDLPTTSKRLSQLTVPEDKNCKSEDSGYAENNRDDRDGTNLANRELVQRVVHLQEQLDALKLTVDNPDQSSTSIRSKAIEFGSYDVVINEQDVPTIKNVKDYNCVIVDPTKKVLVEIGHVNRVDKLKESFHPGQNTPDEETNQIQDGQFTSQQRRESTLSKRQSRFECQSIQKRSSTEQNDFPLQQSANQVPLDNVLRQSSNESKVSRYGFKDIVDSRVDSDQKTNGFKTEDIRIGYCDDTSSHQTLFKSDTQDDLPRVDAADNKVKVHCQCLKCEANLGNRETRDATRLSDEIGDIDVCQKDVEPTEYRKAPAPKQMSYQNVETKLIRTDKVSQESMLPRPTQDVALTDGRMSKKPVQVKNDRHNSLQIPGPLPTDKRDSVVTKISKANDKNESLKGSRAKSKNRGISVEGICGNGPTSPTREERLSAVQSNLFTSVVNPRTADSEIVNDNAPAVSKNTPINSGDKVLNQYMEKKISFESNVTGDVDKASCSRNVKNLNSKTTLAGTQIFVDEDKPIGPNASEPARVMAKPEGKASPSPGNTYVVPESEAHKSRASTPDNTENEISGMTDLPTERDGVTPRDVLSPGEHKATTTYSESYTPGQEQLLSEGEVPNEANQPKRKVSMSIGEYPGDKLQEDINPYNQESSAQRMEAALQAISQELARCRTLLHSQRPREPRPEYKDAASSADPASKESLALHKAEAKSRLSGSFASKCNFTLHVGTIVLSDEAVMSTRDKPLVLSWKFYDQNVTMTRMTAGRVIHFDFSTEYEAKITEEFLEYLKREEMPITICGIDDKDTPFATCALPLREALLNANRRADLSLALVAGSHVASDVHNATDELGVLDLWCMLRADLRHLAVSTTNRDTSVNSGLNSNPRIPQQEKLAQIMDDELSNTYRISQDLDINLNRQKMDQNTTSVATVTGDEKENKDFYVPEHLATNMMATGLQGSASVRNRSKYSGPSISSDLGLSFDPPQTASPRAKISADRGQVGFHLLEQQDSGKSGIIFSEINPKVREIKDVWERNNNVSLPSLEGFEKKDKNRRNTTLSGLTNIIDSTAMDDNRRNGNGRDKTTQNPARDNEAPKDNISIFTDYLSSHKKYQDISRNNISIQSDVGLGKKVTIDPNSKVRLSKETAASIATEEQILSITVLWLALNEECDAMLNPNVRRLYVAYSFLGRDGAELETPISLPKPKHYVDKCYYNFKKSFHLTEFDMPILDHMAKCRSQSRTIHNSKDCIVFTVVSEPPEDPLGLDSCEDIGYAFLYLGDLLAYSAGDTFTEVLPVRGAHPGSAVCGVLAVRLDGLEVLRQLPRDQDQ